VTMHTMMNPHELAFADELMRRWVAHHAQEE
jgi:hypothetical protein